MRSHRIFSPHPLASGRSIPLERQAIRHLLKVLRLRDGDSFVLFDGSGQDYATRLQCKGNNDCWAHVAEVTRSEQPPDLRIHLGIGISRGERMDLAIQKSVELGVYSITPLFTERTVVQLKGERRASRHFHWLGIIHHACEQSGRSLLPKLEDAIALHHWLTDFRGQGILLDPLAPTGLRQLARPGRDITLLVGPEGGLSAEERAAATGKGLQGIRLGPRILRTETAPLAAISALQTLWGDFDGPT